ncbi:MAG: DMT family transporter [Gemmatimonadaceae bacterium]|nr:DMT family transporter [Chitinophagaceae bacterium]
MSEKSKWLNWIIFIGLSFVWGSSFILMKLGLYAADGSVVLSATQVAALRIFSGGAVLLPFFISSVRKIPKDKWGIIILSGLLGSFIPAFLFCIAETRIDSALAGTLNSLTPSFVIITGILLFKTKTSAQKIIGVLISLAGCFMLLFTKETKASDNNWYAGFILIATVMYGANVNMVKQKLNNVGSLNIATFAFVVLTIPSLIILFLSGYFSLPLSQYEYLRATGASALLGIGGTAVASILFYVLVKRAGALFGSMVTYGIPFVAILWGILYGENIGWLEIISLAIILTGVFIVNKNFKPPLSPSPSGPDASR